MTRKDLIKPDLAGDRCCLFANYKTCYVGTSVFNTAGIALAAPPGGAEWRDATRRPDVRRRPKRHLSHLNRTAFGTLRPFQSSKFPFGYFRQPSVFRDPPGFPSIFIHFLSHLFTSVPFSLLHLSFIPFRSICFPFIRVPSVFIGPLRIHIHDFHLSLSVRQLKPPWFATLQLP